MNQPAPEPHTQILFRSSVTAHEELKAVAIMNGYSMARLLRIMVEEQMKRYRSGGFKALIYEGKK